VGRFLAEVLADGAFVSVGEVVWCEKEGITVYAPSGKAAAARAAVVKAEAAEGAKAAPGRTEGDKTEPDKASAAAEQPLAAQEKFPKEQFRYDSAAKVYYCPQGKRLEELTRTTVKRGNGIELPVIVHQASGKDCQACPQQKRCTSNPKKGRVVKRYEGEESLERLRQRMAEPASQQVYKLRGRSVELGYADIKEHRGLRVFRCFGRKRARAQAGLVILASNGLKIMQVLQRRQHAEYHPSSQEKQVV
jgi:hypothetical protein